MRKSFVVGCGLVALACLASRPAAATVGVAIDLTHQRMHVVGAHGSYDWPISSARSGFTTPGGSYAPTRLELMHYSRKYHMSPMPHAIFFRGGYAIHGTYSVGALGRPASHGCVRLSPGHAAALYAMVQREGARISIAGTPPTSRPDRREGMPRFVARRPSLPPDGFDRPVRRMTMASRARLVRAEPAAPVASRRLRRPARGFAGSPTYGYGVVYRYVPAYGYAPAEAYAPLPYAQVPYGQVRYGQVPYAPAYLSATPVDGRVLAPPLTSAYGE